MENDLTPVIDAVTDEVTEAIQRFPPFNSAHEGSNIIREEFEELWEHVKSDTGYSDKAYKEATQVAAMAVRYMLMIKQRQRENRDTVKGTL